MESASPSSLRNLFAQRAYRTYMLGNATALIGYWMQRIAVSWLAWELTGSGFWLAVVAFADLFPALALGPFGGVLADRKDKRRLIIFFQSIIAAQAAALALLAAFDLISITVLIFFALITGTGFAMQESARSSIIRDLVAEKYVPAAVALGAMVFNSARFIGPALAGIVMTVGTVALTIAIHALAALAMVAAILAIEVPASPGPSRAAAGIAADLVEGVRFAAAHAVIAPLMLVFLATTLLVRPVYELLPGLTGEVFAGGVGSLAFFTSCVGVGAVAAALSLMRRGAGNEAGLIRLTFAGAAGTALALFLFVALPSYWLAPVLLFALGYAMATCSTSVQIIIQLAAADHVRARVLSLWGVIIRGGPAAGTPLIGWVATFAGFRWPFIVSSLLCVAVSLGVYASFRRRAMKTN